MNCIGFFCIVLSLLFQSPVPAYHRPAFHGDSFTAGLFASDEAHTYRAMLTADMVAAGGGESPHLLGATGAKMTGPDTASIARDAVAEYNPDFVIIAFGINDTFQMVPDDIFESAARDVFTAYRGRTVQVAGIAWTGESMNNQWTHPRAIALNAVLRRLAREYGYTFVDLFSATNGHWEYLSTPDQPSTFPPYYHGDNLHYNDLGQFVLYRLHRQAMIHHLWLPFLSPRY